MFWTDPILRAPEDEGAGGAAAAEAGAAAQADAAGDTDAGAAAASWWQSDKLTDAQRQHLTHKGLTVDDPVEAAARLAEMHANAERRLGVPADQLLTRPKEGQELGAWMRENAKAFGLPETADGYDAREVLSALPKDVTVDDALLSAAREAALEHGLPPKAFNAMVGVYAQRVGQLVEAADTQLASARDEMMAQLTSDWGDQVPARMAQAKHAAQVLAEKAGLDADAVQQLAGALAAKTGDANVIRMFAAMGEMLGEDRIAGAGQGGGLGTSPAEARAKLAQLRSPEGAYFKAVQEQNRSEMQRLQPEIERLTRIAAGG